MKKFFLHFSLAASLFVASFTSTGAETNAPAAPAAAPAAPRDPTLEERVKDIEQYFNNLAPGTAATDKDPGVKSNIAVAGPGHNAFLMVCAALVLFMTLPGLALFYGGLVRTKNVLSVVAQCFGIAGLVTILWFVCGYSLVFAEGTGPFIGNLKYMFLDGVSGAPNTNYTAWPSQNVFCMFQMMFAIITPALIVGAIAERMKFTAVLLFVGIWMFVVYFPLAHMVWGFDGLMNGVWNGGAKVTAIDFAGGTVVHMSSGWSALILCIILGPRLGFGKEKMAPHSMVLCAVGTGMLWVGWYGFNAGSALAADGIAAQAFMTTTIAAAVASFVWAVLEKLTHGKMSVLGFCSGAVAGLVVITPAAGFVTAKSAFIIGIIAGVFPFLACTKLKAMLGYDDSLDTFGVHAVGGTIGALVTGIFADASVNSNLIGGYAQANGLAVKVGEAFVLDRGALIKGQLIAMGLTIVLSIVATVVIAYIVKAVIGLRATPDVESTGLDIVDHGEEGYVR